MFRRPFYIFTKNTMHFESLSLPKFAYIYNVNIDEYNRLTCGYSVFRGGLSGVISLTSDKGDTVTIEVPEDVAKSATWETNVSVIDDIQLNVVRFDLVNVK